MSLPKFPKTSANERIGVARVSRILVEMGFIFRETPNSDTGIDGYIEEVNNNQEATGRLIAVQIKSGTSYFHDKGDSIVFYADESHVKYWSLYPIPVVLCLHDPDTDVTYFQSINGYTQGLSSKIIIPKSQILSLANRDELMKSIAGFSYEYHTTEQLYDIMKDTRIPVYNSYVSFVDLFVGGMTNLCTDLFCDISILHNLLDLRGKQPTVHIGPQEHEFLWEFVRFVTKENLATVNFGAYLFDWEKRQMSPRFIASLTYRGIDYRNYVDQKHPDTIYEATVLLGMDHYWDEKMERIQI